MSQHDQQARRTRLKSMFEEAASAVTPPKPNRQQRRAAERAEARQRAERKLRRQREAAARQERFAARARAIVRARRADSVGVDVPSHVES